MTVPPRDEWPTPESASEGGALLTHVIIATFRLNARLMEAAQDLAAHGGLTAAWWQVLGGVLDEPHTVAEVGRTMGVSRQGVQRIADLLVERGLAEYKPNPAHRRAKLLACTEAGYLAIRQISVAQHPWTTQLSKSVDLDDLRTTLATMQKLITTLEEA
jgi:DNA-binding MarR family transcriptional regulator